LVPADHFYRHLEQSLDVSFVREFVQRTYESLGRPSIDPVVFFKLQLVLFFEGLRSERQLMRHAADRLSVRWYVGYDLEEPLPDHSSLTRIRERYGLEVFRRFFETIVQQCQEAGLVWGRELYVDGTKVAANAGKESVKPRFAVEAHLRGLFATDAVESVEEAEQQRVQEEPASNDAPVQLPVSLSQAVYEDLSQHNAERHDWIEEVGAQDRRVKGRNYQRIADFQVSTTDPDATIMHSKGGVDLGYHTHYVVDGGRARIIVAALVTPSEVMDNQPMLDLLWRTRFRWKLWPRHITGDKKYGTEENLVAILRSRHSCLHSHSRYGSPDRVLELEGVPVQCRARCVHLPDRQRAALFPCSFNGTFPSLSSTREGLQSLSTQSHMYHRQTRTQPLPQCR
jgi:transposase